MDLEGKILNVLPNLDKTICSNLIKFLEESGLEAEEDLALVEEKDLLNFIPFLMARKLIKSFQRCKDIVSSVSEQLIELTPTTSNISRLNSGPTSRQSPVVLSAFTPTSSDSNWVDRFDLPMNRLSDEIRESLSNGKWLPPNLRREFVRVVVEAVTKLCRKPLKKHMDAIAKLLVASHPLSLKDSIEGDIVGTGYDSLSRQLITRAENINRVCAADRLKDLSPSTSAASDSSGEESNFTSKRRRLEYGCLNSKPQRMPDSETADSLNSKKSTLLAMHQNGEPNWDMDTVYQLMGDTYFLQRSDINSGKLIGHLVNEWPFLFHFSGIKPHMLSLMSVDIEVLQDSPKIKRVLDFLVKHSFHKSTKKIREQVDCVIADLTKPRQSQHDISLPAAILLLMSYFSEEISALFWEVDETATASEVLKLDGLPMTPCLVYCGQSCLLAERYMLLVDGHVVNDNIRSFSDGFSLLFGCFYVLNIEYQQTAAETLDFVQRILAAMTANAVRSGILRQQLDRVQKLLNAACLPLRILKFGHISAAIRDTTLAACVTPCFLKINPDRGSKVARKEKKKTYSINPKVLSLLNQISSFEWCD